MKIDDLVNKIKEWFDQNSTFPDTRAVIGMSGGKDSLTCAMLCMKALGKDRVLGVSLPMYDALSGKYVGEHGMGKYQCRVLDIECIEINILPAVQALLLDNASVQTRINLPARVRMTALYGVSQTCGGRVICTSNLSEDYIGWNTRWGDNVGDVQPLASLTATEVTKMCTELCDEFNIPIGARPYAPTDGLCGKTDEDAFGFTYEVLDRFIRTGVCDDPDIERKIIDMHTKNMFKMNMPAIL